jgi:phage baseplate assembly protein W
MARLTRAESLTQNRRSVEFFSDFTRNFLKTPVGKQLVRVINDDSIQQSLRNLILTNLGERLFQPDIGSNVLNTLFENNYTENYSEIEFYIQNTIDNNEPRVNILEINVKEGQTDHEISVTIVYNTINNNDTVTFNLILKRIR